VGDKRTVGQRQGGGEGGSEREKAGTEKKIEEGGPKDKIEKRSGKKPVNRKNR